MILLAGERQLATVRSKTYESERNITHVIISIASSWAFSVGVVYSLKACVARDFIVALLYSAVFVSAIVWMMRVRKMNVAKWKGHRGTLQFSQSYQVRENVTSATFLYKCFLIYSVQEVLSWLCALIHLTSRDVIKVPIIEETFGFMFDIIVALASTTLPLSIIRYNEKSRKQFRWLLRKIGAYKNEENAESFVDFEGKQTRIKAADETSIYFNQFKEAWS
ncbi:unnamed protein product [Cylicocyclus nassatus]|uniref:Uncharacterized protein n=1 Tax=Cylicocyclus nassatus TaxID=53992 RepID=A0AA36H799_CYLNA|nr:unnamed protein product [Cylicocyclus nassatus]